MIWFNIASIVSLLFNLCKDIILPLNLVTPALSKNQVIRNLFLQLLEDENETLWQYFSSVLLKHTIKASNPKEKKAIAKAINGRDNTYLEKIIQAKLPLTIKNIQNELIKDGHTLKNRLKNQAD